MKSIEACYTVRSCQCELMILLTFGLRIASCKQLEQHVYLYETMAVATTRINTSQHSAGQAKEMLATSHALGQFCLGFTIPS